MITSILILILGIYFGQEFEMYIPNVRITALNIMSYIQRKYIEENDKFNKENEEKNYWSFINW